MEAAVMPGEALEVVLAGCMAAAAAAGGGDDGIRPIAQLQTACRGLRDSLGLACQQHAGAVLQAAVHVRLYDFLSASSRAMARWAANMTTTTTTTAAADAMRAAVRLSLDESACKQLRYQALLRACPPTAAQLPELLTRAAADEDDCVHVLLEHAEAVQELSTAAVMQLLRLAMQSRRGPSSGIRELLDKAKHAVAGMDGAAALALYEEALGSSRHGFMPLVKCLERLPANARLSTEQVVYLMQAALQRQHAACCMLPVPPGWEGGALQKLAWQLPAADQISVEQLAHLVKVALQQPPLYSASHKMEIPIVRCLLQLPEAQHISTRQAVELAHMALQLQPADTGMAKVVKALLALPAAAEAAGMHSDDAQRLALLETARRHCQGLCMVEVEIALLHAAP
ncbi:hypothetical protein COO60DRAFT_1671580 [Scenedesmus sp. NREL 46B-D3]|nr:hypothetical protein COO60DRAFT_1671580 [Scenedesmus sp. NREL 46B-D3]